MSKSNHFRMKKGIENKIKISIVGRFTGLIFILSLISIIVLLLLKVYAYQLLPKGAPILLKLDFEDVILVKKQKNTSFIEDDSGNYLLIDTNQKIVTYNLFDLYLYPVLLISFINILSIFIFSFYFSNRIASPIYRIKAVLSEYMDVGSYVPIVLRRKDFLQDVVLLLNRLFIKLDARNRIMENSQKVEEQLKFDTKPNKKNS